MSKGTTKPTNKKADVSSSSSSSDWGSEESSSEEEGTQTEFKAQFEEEDLPKDQYDQEAPVEFSKARFYFEESFTPEKLFDSKGALKNEGKLIFSVSNGRLKLDRHSNNEDFPLAAPVEQTLDAKHPHHKKRNPHHHRHRKGTRSLNRDIVKEVTLSKFTTTWEKGFGVELSTVRGIGSEGWHDRSEFVSRAFAPKEVSATEPRDYEVLSRKITKGTILFQNRYPGSNIENFDADYTKAGANMLIPFRNPFVMYHNAIEAKKITGPTQNLEGLVQVPLDIAKKYTEITRKEMRASLSFGDVTNDLSIAFFIPMPDIRLAGHNEFIATGKGSQFEHFADRKHAIPMAKLNAKNEQGVSYATVFDKTEFTIAGFVDCLYLKCNGKRIPINTKQ